MTVETPPPRRALATFLRSARSDDHPTDPAPAPTPAPTGASGELDPPAGASAAVDALAIADDASATPPPGPVYDASPADPAAAEETALADSGDELGLTAGQDDIPVLDSEPMLDSMVVPDSIALPAMEAAAPPPSFLRGSRQVAPALRTPPWQWTLAAVLGLVLLLQVAIADRANLAADAGTRPLVSGLCNLLRCSLPPWHEPAAFTMLSRDIRQVPGRAGALQVQASFRNDARWAQAWPTLRLSLSDADGRLIGRRLFTPDDYLGGAHEPAQVLAPGQSAQVAFRIREPAAATDAFSFEFQ